MARASSVPDGPRAGGRASRTVPPSYGLEPVAPVEHGVVQLSKRSYAVSASTNRDNTKRVHAMRGADRTRAASMRLPGDTDVA